MIRKYFYKILFFFSKKPRKKLIWTVEDYEKGRKWALSQPHPVKKNLTLWDFVYDRYESTYTIANLNKFI